MLIGESVLVEKDVNVVVLEKVLIGDCLNMFYLGCFVMNGCVMVVVVEIGMEIEMGKIVGFLNSILKLMMFL